MSDDMKKMMALMEAMNAKLTSLTEEVAALKKQPKTPAKEEQKPDTSFAALYGALLTNADGSGKKFKHSADTKDGGEDDWFGVWDAKHKVVKRVNEDGSETDDVCDTFGDFGTAHYKSLGENNKKKLTHDSNGGWDKVKVYDIVKRKFFSANTLLPMGEKPRSQSRAKSASRRSNAAAAAGGGAELAIAKPKNSRRKPQPSPKVMEAAQNGRARRRRARRRRPPPTAADRRRRCADAADRRARRARRCRRRRTPVNAPPNAPREHAREVQWRTT